MIAKDNHYQVLEVSQTATQTEIKQAYRRLVKQFHPDAQGDGGDRQRIVSINGAYEVLKDPQRRRSYDRQLVVDATPQRQQRTSEAQNSYRKQRQRQSNFSQHQWLQQVYRPIGRIVTSILNSLDPQLEALSADPFDDTLVAEFEDYLTECRETLEQARLVLASQPNPAKFANIAAHLYFCLNQISDGIDELKWFTLNYDEHYLHTGKELFRIAHRLYGEAQATAKAIIL